MAVFLKLLARLTYRHPVLVLFGCLVLGVVAVVATARHLSLDTNISALFPRDAEFHQFTQEAIRDFGSFDFMLAMLEARGEADAEFLTQVAPEVAHALADARFFHSIDYRVDSTASHLMNRMGPDADLFFASLMTDTDWDRLDALFDPETTDRALAAYAHRLAHPLSKEKFDALASDPLGWDRIVRERLMYAAGPAKVNLRDGYYRSENGRMLLMILHPAAPAPRGSRREVSVSSSADLAMVERLGEFLDQTRAGLFQRNPDWEGRLRIGFVGPHVEAIRSTRIVRNDFHATLITSFLAVAALFYLTFRRFEMLYFIGIPLLFGIVWTLGLTAGTMRHLTIISAAMGAVLVGLGVDYGILFYNRFLEEIHRGVDVEAAIETILTRTGRGIITGGLAATAGFLALALTSFRGFQELGAITAMGLLCCLAAMLLMLPSMMTLRLRHRADSVRRRPLLTLGLPQLSAMVLMRPRTTLAVGILVTAYLGMVASDTTFDDSIARLHQPSRSYLRTLERMDKEFRVPTNQILAIVEGDTLDEALLHNDILYRNIESWNERAREKVLSFDSLRLFLPSVETQRQVQTRMLAFRREWPTIKDRLVEQAKEYNLVETALDPFFSRIESIFVAIEKHPTFRFETLPAPFLQTAVQRYVAKTRDGRFRILTRIFPPKDQWNDAIPDSFLESLRLGHAGETLSSLDVQVTGIVFHATRLKQTALRDLARTSLFVVATVFLILLLHFRRVGISLLALLPVALSVVWTLGIWNLLGLRINFMNIIVIPIVLGIGVHSGLHLLERYREMGYRRLGLVIETTGRGLLLTALTTMLGFGSLSLADYRGLQEMGLLTIVGVGTNLIAALVFLPATIRLVERGLTFEDWNPQDLG